MEVIVKDCSDHPSCPHGPCLMFERKTAKKNGKRFFACSASRSRNICSYFQYVDDKIQPSKQKVWEKIIEDSKPKFTHQQYMKKLSSFRKLPSQEKLFCQTCSELISKNLNTHKNHNILNVAPEQLEQPSTLLNQIGENKAEAQYFFTPKDVKFMTTLLRSLNYTKVVNIGTPKIHEWLLVHEKEYNVQTLLLDLDKRYMQFYDTEHFCHYNMFNNHFFGGEASEEKFKQFLKEENGEKIAVVVDPPFGGLIAPLSYNLLQINKLWQSVNGKDSSEMLSILWIFPYFFESRIIENIPSLAMTDYKVQYSNHLKFKKKAGPKKSPVRIFTNIPGSLFTLPEKDGYKYCETCERWVCEENEHCSMCNKCTTKHGKTYKHCEICQQCVKSKYDHCKMHNMCSLHTITSHCSCKPQSEDGGEERCYLCDGIGHRKRDCPENLQNPKKKMKKSRLAKKCK